MSRNFKPIIVRTRKNINGKYRIYKKKTSS